MSGYIHVRHSALAYIQVYTLTSFVYKPIQQLAFARCCIEMDTRSARVHIRIDISSIVSYYIYNYFEGVKSVL